MKRLVIILSGAAILVALLIVTGKRNHPFGKDNSSIAVPPGKEIDRIIMTGEGQSLTLVREGERIWTINGNTEARISAVTFILKTLQSIEIKSPVTTQFFNDNVTVRGISPVKVEAYSSGRRVTSFLLYRFSDDPLGNIVRRSPASRPFIAHIPGYSLNPGSHFITDARFWIPFNIFNYNPADIDTVTLSSRMGGTGDLLITRGEKGYELFIGGSKALNTDSTAIERYLAYFTYVPFESWALQLGDSEKREISMVDPAYRITVSLTGGNKDTLLLWKRYFTEGGVSNEDTDRLWGSLNGGGDIFVVRYYDIDPLLKRADYFISD